MPCGGRREPYSANLKKPRNQGAYYPGETKALPKVKWHSAKHASSVRPLPQATRTYEAI